MELDPTPHIDFAPGADIVFSATPQLPTPNMRVNKLMSSASSVRLSRWVRPQKGDLVQIQVLLTS